MNNSKRFVINSLPDFPNFILEAKNTIELQNWIINCCSYLITLKQEEIIHTIIEFFSDKIIHGQQNLSTGCYRFDGKGLCKNLIVSIENKL